MAIVIKADKGTKSDAANTTSRYEMYPEQPDTPQNRQSIFNLGIESVEDLATYLRMTGRNPDLYDLQKFFDDNDPSKFIHGMSPFKQWILEEQRQPGGAQIPDDYYIEGLTFDQNRNPILPNNKQFLGRRVSLKRGGSILDQLKEQLPEMEIFDLLSHFGIDDILEGGLKDTGSVSIQITIDGSDEDKKVPDLKEIDLGDNTYKVEVVDTPEEMEKGLSDRKSLGEDEGMLFDFGSVQPEVSFWMKDTYIPLDIIFINDDDEVVKVYPGEPQDETLITVKNIRYVVELNRNSGVQKGDDLDFNPKEEGPVMKVLAPDGSTQMELKGGERIFSRKNTKTLIRMAKRANKSKSDTDYRKLGKRMFKYIHTQDTNTPEYVEVPEN